LPFGVAPAFAQTLTPNADSLEVLDKEYQFRSVSATTATFTNYFSMRRKEGSFPEPTPAEIASVTGKTDLALLATPADQPRATWIGHATVLAQYHGINFLTDPILTDKASPVDLAGPQRFVPPSVAFAQLPKIDFIAISHNHYDHLDHRTVDMFGNSVTWFVPLGLKRWFLGRGIEAHRVIELNWWESYELPRVKLTFTPAQHWSKRTPWDTDKTLWGSWAISVDSVRFWFGGDTGYDSKMFQEIGTRAGPFDLAFIPIGAYGPRYFMSPQHIDPAEAVKVFQEIRAERAIPIHWATFQLTHEPYLEPPRLLQEAMVAAKLDPARFAPIKIGESVTLIRSQSPQHP
jgi:N-acyl-phosphatidylethanolamine-hydrolysing phospholipase D